MSGLDPLDSTDNLSDYDRDGASALQEFCWPYSLESCFTTRLSLTGKSPEETESGFREYLDPRRSDTDGDGLPDGFEISMCTDGGAGYIDQASTAWVCLHFDPLDPGMQSKIQINAWVYLSGVVEMDMISTGTES